MLGSIYVRHKLLMEGSRIGSLADKRKQTVTPGKKNESTNRSAWLAVEYLGQLSRKHRAGGM